MKITDKDFYTQFCFWRKDHANSPLGDYYLAHPINSRKEVREWELKFENRTGISLINPFYDVSREDINDLDAGVIRIRKRDHIFLVESDLKLIKKSDKGLVAIINETQTFGTLQEMVYAHQWGKKVYSIITNGKHEHPWLKYHSSKIFLSLDEFEKWIIENK